MKPCPHCAGGVWVVRGASYSSGKQDTTVFACKQQENLALATHQQDTVPRETDEIASPPVSLENAAPSPDQSQKSLVTAIPTSTREDSPEIEYRPPVLCLPVADKHQKTRRKHGSPNSAPFETGVRADKRVKSLHVKNRRIRRCLFANRIILCEKPKELSLPVSLENAAPSPEQSQMSPVTAIPTSIREDSPEIEYCPPASCLPVTKTYEKDRKPNSVLPFETGVGADKRIHRTVPPLTLQPPCAVDDHLSDAASALSSTIANANAEHREKTKRKLRTFTRKRTMQLDFVEDDSDVDPDWAPEKAFDFSRIESEDESFSDDDSASVDQCPKRKRRNASSNRSLACTESSWRKFTESGLIISPHTVSNVETITVSTIVRTVSDATMNIAPAKPTTENRLTAIEGVKNPRSTAESIPETIKSGLQEPRIERITMSASAYSKKDQIAQTRLLSSSLGNLVDKGPVIGFRRRADVKAVPKTTNIAAAKQIKDIRPAAAEGVEKPWDTVETVLTEIKSGLPCDTVETVLTAIKSGLEQPRIERVTRKKSGLQQPKTRVTTVQNGSCRPRKAAVKRGLKQPIAERVIISLGSNSNKVPGVAPVSSIDDPGWMPDIISSDDDSDDQCPDPLPEPKIQRTIVGRAPGQCPLCGRDCPDVAVHVRQNHFPRGPRRKEFPVLSPQESELCLEHLEETGSFGYCCCGCFYPNKAVLQLHQAVHRKDFTGSSERECPCCDFVAISFDDLVQHASQHALDAEAYKMCFLCEWTGTDIYAHWRNSHRELNNKIRFSHKFRCKLCRNRYRSREELNDHVREIHPSDEPRESAVEYMQTTGFLSYHCPTCAQYFPSRRLLDLHNFSHASVDALREPPERQCPACAFVGIDFSSLVEHTATHGIKSSEKKQCLFCSNRVINLWQHCSRFHPEYRDLVWKDWLQCEHCEQKFMAEPNLKQHFRMMHAEVQCLYCALRFYADVKLSQHARAEHRKDGVFPCPVCPKSYKQYWTVQLHYRKVHDISQVVLCDVCQRVFRNKNQLKLHFMAKHSNEYRFVCKQCGKKYQTYLLLHQHVVRHHRWTEADRRRFSYRQKERRAAHKKKALEKASDEAEA